MMSNIIRMILIYLILFSNYSFANDDLSKAISPTVYVTGQMTTTKFSALLQQNFKSVIINRPDVEIDNQVTARALTLLAANQDIPVIYQPVRSGHITQADIEKFATYYNALPKPILLVCRSGARSTTLFNQAKNLGLLDE